MTLDVLIEEVLRLLFSPTGLTIIGVSLFFSTVFFLAKCIDIYLNSNSKSGDK